jgi:hypothetical protein
MMVDMMMMMMMIIIMMIALGPCATANHLEGM